MRCEIIESQVQLIGGRFEHGKRKSIFLVFYTVIVTLKDLLQKLMEMSFEKISFQNRLSIFGSLMEDMSFEFKATRRFRKLEHENSFMSLILVKQLNFKKVSLSLKIHKH